MTYVRVSTIIRQNNQTIVLTNNDPVKFKRFVKKKNKNKKKSKKLNFFVKRSALMCEYDNGHEKEEKEERRLYHLSAPQPPPLPPSTANTSRTIHRSIRPNAHGSRENIVVVWFDVHLMSVIARRRYHCCYYDRRRGISSSS